MDKIQGKCKNCGRPIVFSRGFQVHRFEDFEPNKPIDCFEPELAEDNGEAK